MPPKIRQLKSSLSKAGFVKKPGKGSHTVWEHPVLLKTKVTISGKNGDDTRHYLIEEVQNALDQLKGTQK